MRTQSIDTAPEIERIQIARIRSFSSAKKFASVCSWTHTLTFANLYTTHNCTTETDTRDIAMRFVAQEYGSFLADDFKADLEWRPDWSMGDPDLIGALTPIVDVFEHLEVKYALSGSIACSLYGLPRAVQDIDLVADLCGEHLPAFITQLQQNYTINEASLHAAIQQRSVLHLLHLSSLTKIDIFLTSTDHSFDSTLPERAQQHFLVEDLHPFWVITPEDIALLSLRWYKAGGAIADNQWNDILGLFKVQACDLDLQYLQQQSASLHITDLLTQAFIDAGATSPL